MGWIYKLTVVSLFALGIGCAEEKKFQEDLSPKTAPNYCSRLYHELKEVRGHESSTAYISITGSLVLHSITGSPGLHSLVRHRTIENPQKATKEEKMLCQEALESMLKKD